MVSEQQAECFVLVWDRVVIEENGLLGGKYDFDVRLVKFIPVSKEKWSHAALLEDDRYDIVGRLSVASKWVELFCDNHEQDLPYLGNQFERIGYKVTQCPAKECQANMGTRPLRSQMEKWEESTEHGIRALIGIGEDNSAPIACGIVVGSSLMGSPILRLAPITNHEAYSKIIKGESRTVITEKGEKFRVLGVVKDGKVTFIAEEDDLAPYFNEGEDMASITWVQPESHRAASGGLTGSNSMFEVARFFSHLLPSTGTETPDPASPTETAPTQQKQKQRGKKKEYQKRRKAERKGERFKDLRSQLVEYIQGFSKEADELLPVRWEDGTGKQSQEVYPILTSGLGEGFYRRALEQGCHVIFLGDEGNEQGVVTKELVVEDGQQLILTTDKDGVGQLSL